MCIRDRFTPTLAHQENNKTNIIQGIPFSYAPQQTMLEQPTFYEYVKTYIVSQDPSSKSKVDRAIEKDSQSIKHAQNNFFKQKTAYEMSASLVGSEMCIRDRI
ncbi:hypothetical protein JMUB7550_27510 [Staphylococcus aureus]